MQVRRKYSDHSAMGQDRSKHTHWTDLRSILRASGDRGLSPLERGEQRGELDELPGANRSPHDPRRTSAKSTRLGRIEKIPPLDRSGTKRRCELRRPDEHAKNAP